MAMHLFGPNFRPQFKKTWQLAWPVILANLSLPLLSLADAAILGHLEESIYLAGVTAGGSIMAYVFWGFNFLSMGLSGFTSQSLGRKDKPAVVLQLKRYAIVAATLIFIVLICQRLFITGGLNVISPTLDVRTEADIYLSIRMLGVPAIVFNSMLLGFFIGLQNTRISLYTLSITQILNIGFNLFFVFGLGYKTAGIAVGTVISEYLGLILILWQLRKTLKSLNGDSAPIKLSFNWAAFSPIFSVSSHLFIRTFILLSAFVWFNRISATFGEVTLAANGVLLAFFTLIAHFLDGTAAAAEAQTGHAFGQNDQHQLKQVWLASALLNSVFMITLSMLFIIAGTQLLGILTTQTEILNTASQQMLWVAVLPITGGIAFWLDGVFIGARRSKDMRNSVIAAFVVLILTSHLFADTNSTLWACFNGFFAIRSLWLLTVFYKKML